MDDNFKPIWQYSEPEKSKEKTFNKREMEIMLILMQYSFAEIKELYEKIS